MSVKGRKIKKRRAWTPAEVRDLKTLARQGTKASKIARSLRRTEGATRQKALTVGVSLDSRVKRRAKRAAHTRKTNQPQALAA